MIAVSTVRIAWRNLGRNKRRAALAVAAIAMGQLGFLGTAALMRGYMGSYLDSVTGPLVGHAQVHAPDWRDERSVDLIVPDLDAVLEGVRGDPNVASASPRIYAPALAALEEEGFTAMVVGMEASSESHGAGLLGEAGPPVALTERRVLVGRGFARRYGIEDGDELALVGQDVDGSIANDLFTVAGVIGSPVELVNSLGVLMSIEDAQEFLAMGDAAHEVVIHSHDRELIDETVLRLREVPALSGLETLAWHDIVPQAVVMMKVVDAYLYIFLAIVLIAAVAGIANTMLMSTFERSHEFGMLLSLGCGPGRLTGMVAVEAVALGQLGVALGTALGVAFVAATSSTGIDYMALGGGQSTDIAWQGLQLSSLVYPKLHLPDVAVGAAAVFLTSILATVWPSIHIARMEPMEAMRT